MALKIGFTEKYFTLWDVSNENIYCVDWQGNSYLSSIRTNNCYLQNLSMDEGKAIEKAKAKGCKNLMPDTDLYGQKRSFYTEKKMDAPAIPDDRFQYGQYKTELISTNEDLKYLFWYSNQFSSVYIKNDHQRNIANRILELDSNRCIYKDELIQKETRTFYKIVDKMKSGKIEVQAVSNFKKKDNGFYSVRVVPAYNDEHKRLFSYVHDYGMEIKVEDTLNLQEREYNGFKYYVPQGSRSFKKTIFKINGSKIII